MLFRPFAPIHVIAQWDQSTNLDHRPLAPIPAGTLRIQSPKWHLDFGRQETERCDWYIQATVDDPGSSNVPRFRHPSNSVLTVLINVGLNACCKLMVTSGRVTRYPTALVKGVGIGRIRVFEHIAAVGW